MFERYTEKARRTIFFARYEAAQIAPEHLLLGLLREPNPLWKYLGSMGDANLFRMEIGPEVPVAERIPSNKELPFSAEVKQALRLAAEEADSLKQQEIGTKHLLLGLLRLGDCRALQILTHRGSDMEKAIGEGRTTTSKDCGLFANRITGNEIKRPKVSLN